MRAPAYSVRLIRPDGAELGVASRIRELGELNQETEITLAELSHSDLDLELEDLDGSVEAFLGRIAPADIYEVLVDRAEPGPRRRGKVLRVFGGVLDLPWSLSFDRRRRTASVRVFSYAKLLESEGADAVRRTFPALTGTVGAGFRTLALNTASHGLRRGDRILVISAAAEEEHILDYVHGGGSANVETIDVFANSFTNAEVIVLSPYHRYITPAALATALLGLVPGLRGRTDFTQPIAPVPLLQSINVHGLRGFSNEGRVACLVETFPGELTIRSGAPDWEFRQTGGVVNDWVVSGSTSTTLGDWRPYLLARPLNFPTATGRDSGLFAWDHTNNRRYSLSISSGGGTSTLELAQNGILIATIDSYGTNDGYPFTALEFDPTNDQVWVAYRRGNGSANVIEIYDVASTVQTTIGGATAGHLRMARPLDGVGRMLWVNEAKTEIRAYSLGTGAQAVRIVTGSPVPSRLWPWTFRVSRGRIYAAYDGRGRTRIRIWNPAWTVLADFDFGPTRRPALIDDDTAMLTVYDDPVSGEVVVGWNGWETYGVLAERWAGVIPYADMDGLSAAAALRELALATLTVVRADNHRGIVIAPRNRLGTRRTILREEPLEEEELPLWEHYRTAATVSSKTEAGEEFTEFGGLGSQADSKRLDLDIRWAQTGALAKGLAGAYAASLSVERRERRVRVRGVVGPIAPLDVVRIDGRDWFVLESSWDLESGDQDLRIVEVKDPVQSRTTITYSEEDIAALGPFAWFRADDPLGTGSLAGLTNGQDISSFSGGQWKDVSGNGRHSPATGGVSPRWWNLAGGGVGQPSSLPNGKPVIGNQLGGGGTGTFDMVVGGPFSLGDFTVFAVTAPRLIVVGGDPPVFAAGNVGFQCQGNQSGSGARWDGTTSPGTSAQQNWNDFPSGGWRRVMFRRPGFDGLDLDYKEGTTLAMRGFASNTGVSSSWRYLFRRLRNDGATLSDLGHTPEIIVFNRALSTSAALVVEGYLDQKYGLG